MEGKILLSTHIFNLSHNKESTEVYPLDEITDNEDQSFISVFSDFYRSIATSPYLSKKSQYVRRLTTPISEAEVTDITEEEVCGYFKYGSTGEKHQIDDNATNTKLLEVDPIKHTTYRKIFFYLYIPKGSVDGYLILQKKSKAEARGTIHHGFIKHIQNIKSKQKKVRLYDRFPIYAYKELLKQGKVTKIDMIINSIPLTKEDYFKGKKRPTKKKGKLTHTIKSKDGLGPSWKQAFDDWMTNYNGNSFVDIENGDSYNEISCDVEVDGRKTTLYIVKQENTLPAIDVTDMVELDKNGDPTLESLVRNSKNIIEDIFKLKPSYLE